MTTLIAAVAKNGVIGNRNTIPWHIPADFKHFSATTKGHAVIMGSRTWHSLPEKFRPLPKRHNFIVTRNKTRAFEENLKHVSRPLDLPKLFWFSSIQDAVELAEMASEEVFIIGGASIYEQAIGLADRLLISEIPLEPEGDTFFPEIGPEWELISATPMDGFSVLDYRKINGLTPVDS